MLQLLLAGCYSDHDVASTQPGDGGKSHVVSSPVEEAQSSASKIPWKDQVLGE